jgi:transcriptional regulator with XRE-family HTH domain
MELGKRIKAKMKAKKITATAMAEACGVTPSAVSSWFRTSRIGKGTLAKVASVLDEDLEALITGDEDASDHSSSRPHKPSYDAAHLATWLDRITDAERRGRIAHECMALILRELDGPHLQPTAEPDPQSRTLPAAPRVR